MLQTIEYLLLSNLFYSIQTYRSATTKDATKLASTKISLETDFVGKGKEEIQKAIDAYKEEMKQSVVPK